MVRHTLRPQKFYVSSELYSSFLMYLAGNGLDIDEYVRRAYKFAYSDCIEVGPVACLPEPPDPNELYPRQSRRQVFLLIVRTNHCLLPLDFSWVLFLLEFIL